MKHIVPNLFKLIFAAALIWVCSEPETLDAGWLAGELIGLAVMVVSGRLALRHDSVNL